MRRSNESPFDVMRPLIGTRADALDLAWRTGDLKERGELEIVAEVLKMQATRNGSALLKPPPGNQADGPIRLGRILHGHRQLGHAGITARELSEHLLAVGRSGSGKSNLCLHVMDQLRDRSIPWLIFDYKRSSRALRGLSGHDDVHVLSLGRDFGCTFRFNPLAPLPGVPLDSHIRTLCQLIAGEWFAGDGVINLLERSMRDCYAASAPAIPTLRDVFTYVQQQSWKGREAQWGQSLYRVLQQLTTGTLGEVLNGRADNVALHQLLSHHTILELDGLATNDANFVVQCIVQFLVAALLQAGKPEQLNFACLIEEAHHLLGNGGQTVGRDTPLELAMREARECGLGILLATQSISAMSPTACANTFTTVSLNCRHRADITAAAGSLLLDDQQRELLATLPTGEAVCRLSGRWPYPIHLRVPPLDLPKGTITDAMLAAAYLQGPYCRMVLDQLAPTDSTQSGHSTSNQPPPITALAIPPLPLDDNNAHVPDSMTTHLDHQIASHQQYPRPPPHQTQHPQPVLRELTPPTNPIDEDPDLQLMLRSIAEQPLLGTAKRCDLLQLSRRKGMACRDRLIELGYAQAEPITIPEGKTVLLALTDPARRWLQRHHITPAPLNGSLLHAYWQDRLAQALTDAGWSVTTERLIGSSRVDLHAERSGHILLVECETGRSAWQKNLKALAACAADHRVVVWLDRASQLQAKQFVPAGVTFLTPKTILRWLKASAL